MLFNIEVQIGEDAWKLVRTINASDIENAYHMLCKSKLGMIDNKPTYYRVEPVRNR